MSPISLNPATFVEGGLPGDDTDAEIVDARFMLYNYEGKSDSGDALVLGMQLQPLNANGVADGKVFDQYYSAGDKKYFTPSADNSELIPVADKQALNNNTNLAMLFAAMVQIGLPVTVLETGKSTALIGLRAHWNRVAQKKRQGLVNTKSDGREATILLPSRIISLPGQTAGRVATGGTGGLAAKVTQAAPPTQLPVSAPIPAGVTPQPSNGADPNVDALAAETLIGILAMNGGSIAKKDLATAAFRAEGLTGHPLKAKVVARVFQDQFLTSTSGVRFDGVTVSMG